MVLCTIQILSNCNIDASPSFLLTYDHQRYLFNCPEGTQRICTEYRGRLVKLKHIVLTNLNWNCVGGLPGMVLTVADQGVRHLRISGPEGLHYCIGSFRHFVWRRDTTVTLEEFQKNPTQAFSYDDAHLRLTPIIVELSNEHIGLIPEIPSEIPSSHPDFPHNLPSTLESSNLPSTLESSNLVQSKNHEWGMESTLSLSPDALSSLCEKNRPKRQMRISYICQAADMKGKFDPVKAQSLGIRPGPLFGQLQNGQSVVNAQGQTIRPEDVMSASTPGSVFVVIDCPTVDHAIHLIKATEFLAVQKNGPLGKVCAFVLHCVSQSVIQFPDYQKWISNFNFETKHLFFCPEYRTENLIYRQWACNQIKLNMIDPKIWPLPFVSNHMPVLPSGLPANSQVIRSMTRLRLSPLSTVGIDLSEVPPDLDFNVVRNEALNVQSFVDALHLDRNQILQSFSSKIEEKYQDIKDILPLDEPVVVFTGTGAALPAIYRNVSGCYLSLPSFGGILLDCGEGTLGQLSRKFGPHLIQIIFELKMVLISHMHADHHLGLIGLLEMRDFLFFQKGKKPDPVIVVAPKSFGFWLQERSVIHPTAHRFVYCGEFCSDSHDDVQVQAIPVVHCPDSFAFVIQTKTTKLVYSGDTRPCEALVKAGSDCDLLIHEATFEDEMKDDAIGKNHSTTGEAIGVGSGMRAKNVLLFHFSQRYPKIPVLDSSSLKVGLAFDLMTIPFSRLSSLPLFLPALQALFSEEEKREQESLSQNDENPSISASKQKKPPKKFKSEKKN